MKYIILILCCLYSNVIIGQQRNCQPIVTTDFNKLADSLQVSIDELCNYPIISPIKRPFRISSNYGMRIHPITKKRKKHNGIDIPKPKGTLVHATGNGVVIAKGNSSSYGNFIEIKHAGGYSSFYAHLDKIFVNIRDSVQIMDRIASVGKTGLATGYHVHYEVKKKIEYRVLLNSVIVSLI